MKLPKAETLIIVAFLVCTAVWAVSKCSSRRAEQVRTVRDIESDEAEDKPVKRDSAVAPKLPAPDTKPAPPGAEMQHPAPPVVQTPQNVAAPQPGQTPKRPVETTPKAPVTPAGTTLYVTIDGLKVRKEPGLKGETLEELKLYDPVTFLNKKTDWTQEISLGYEKVTDHWVKVRTKAGKEGWVFGAGVHYYKMKRQGVIEDKKPAAETPPKKKN